MAVERRERIGGDTVIAQGETKLHAQINFLTPAYLERTNDFLIFSVILFSSTMKMKPYLDHANLLVGARTSLALPDLLCHPA